MKTNLQTTPGFHYKAESNRNKFGMSLAEKN